MHQSIWVYKPEFVTSLSVHHQPAIKTTTVNWEHELVFIRQRIPVRLSQTEVHMGCALQAGTHSSFLFHFICFHLHFSGHRNFAHNGAYLLDQNQRHNLGCAWNIAVYFSRFVGRKMQTFSTPRLGAHWLYLGTGPEQCRQWYPRAL